MSIAILMGGPSTEHKISLLSGNSIYKAIDKNKYEVHVIGVDHDTCWWWYPTQQFLENETSAADIHLANQGLKVTLSRFENKTTLINAQGEQVATIDLFFPVLHGSYGEDGVLQGVLESVGAAYAGVGLLASSAGMDKYLAKRVWKQALIPVAKDIVVKKHEKNKITYTMAVAELGLPLFIKPANAGSSVGVSKVEDETSFYQAMDEAFLYDLKILIEEAVIGKEVECAVLGNEDPKASVLGEIIPKASFYSYEAKYLDADGASMAIPANVPEDISNKIRNYAVQAFTSLGCEGLARVDFFLTKDGKIVLNEINTLPGFTSISMYPKLWEATGLPYSELIDHIITLGWQRHHRNRQLRKLI